MNTIHPIAPPAGTAADTWQPETYRIVYGPRRHIPGRENVNVAVTGVQFTDGTIDDGTVLEPPMVYPDHPDGMTAAQARGLAALLMAAADEIEGWVTR
ncbi:MAG: hypothetical protein U0R66_03345 [Mycobacterium sp.]